jgi:hypothetical protein
MDIKLIYINVLINFILSQSAQILVYSSTGYPARKAKCCLSGSDGIDLASLNRSPDTSVRAGFHPEVTLQEKQNAAYQAVTGLISLRSIGPFHPEVTLQEKQNAASAAFDVF